MAGSCTGKMSPFTTWANTLSGGFLPPDSVPREVWSIATQDRFRTVEKIVLQSGDICQANDWVITSLHSSNSQLVGRMVEIIQVKESSAELAGHADAVLLALGHIQAPHTFYHMPSILLTDRYIFVDPKVCPLTLCMEPVHEACLYDTS